MSDHADVIREALEYADTRLDDTPDPFAALDALVAERDRAYRDGHMAAEAENARLREALAPFLAYLAREQMIYGFNEDDLAPLRALAPSATGGDS